jgi:hypothetical protein
MIDIKKIEKELSDLPDSWIVLLETSAEKAMEVSLAAIKILTRKGYTGIILSASRPYLNLVNLYRSNGIDEKKIFVLDCISKSQVTKLEAFENVMYIEHVSDLTSMAICITDCIKKIKGSKFVFVDSVTTMLIHNKPNTFAAFIHSILTKMRINSINGLLISIEAETNKEVRAEIAQLCDKVIKI